MLQPFAVASVPKHKQQTNQKKEKEQGSPRVCVAPLPRECIIKNDKSHVASICGASSLRPFRNTKRHGSGALAHRREDQLMSLFLLLIKRNKTLIRNLRSAGCNHSASSLSG